jgi:hypothetical protein
LFAKNSSLFFYFNIIDKRLFVLYNYTIITLGGITMAVRMNLSIGDELDSWIAEKAESLGIAKNAFVIMCVANARNQEENMKMMSNSAVFETIEKILEQEKEH